MRAVRELPAGYEEIGKLDWEESVVNRRVLHILRFAAAIFFVPLFAGATIAVRPTEPFNPVDLWTISIPGFGAFGAYLALLLVVAGTLYLHQLVHAAAARLTGGTAPQLALRGLRLSVSVPLRYLSKAVMIATAVSAFLVISVLGVALISLVPAEAIAWLYLPVVANAIASARDVMKLSWLAVAPRRCLFSHGGDVLKAFAPRGTVPHRGTSSS